MMAGKASAADVECLKRIRDDRLYKCKSERWSEFCDQNLGSSKAQIDRHIRYLEEFGSAFFELSAVTRISPESYRTIAGHVVKDGLRLDGEIIPITQENSQRVAAAVTELRRRAEPPRIEAPEGFGVGQAGYYSRFGELRAHFVKLIESMQVMTSLGEPEKGELAAHIASLRKRVAKLGVRGWE